MNKAEVYHKLFSERRSIIVGQYDDQKNLNSLKEKIINAEKNLSYKTNVRGEMTDFKYFNQDSDFHQFLQNITENIFLLKDTAFTIDDSWGNIYSKEGDYALAHDHRSATVASGILYFNNEGPGTYFQEYDLTVNEKIGRYVIFHPKLLHEVKKYNYTSKRITLAFNLVDAPLDFLLKKKGINK
jgi:hypothetical protein